MWLAQFVGHISRHQTSLLMILILTDEIMDDHTQCVSQKLRERRADVRVFNPGTFPARAQLSITYSPAGETCRRFHTEMGDIDLDDCRAVWFRRPDQPKADARITNPTARRMVELDSKQVLQNLYDSMECFWLPGAPAMLGRTQLKVAQLKLAGQLGFELPPTLISNSPADFLEFYRAHNGEIISKLAGLSFFDTFGTRLGRYTELVSPRDVAYAPGVRFCPMIFQAYVAKRLELRITVVGDQVFAAEIHSQQTNRTRHDWRRYDLEETPHLPHSLPEAISRLCVRLVRRMGLSYGAIDMILTPDGRYVFLEINPNGQYYWIEQMTGLPISDAVCDLLIAGDRNESRSESVNTELTTCL
jgi:glutathione synthase/RimK-type ligase-like ATP-grasp enzyme